MDDDRFLKWATGIVITMALFVLALFVLVVFIVLHFVFKYW